MSVELLEALGGLSLGLGALVIMAAIIFFLLKFGKGMLKQMEDHSEILQEIKGWMKEVNNTLIQYNGKNGNNNKK